MSNAVELRIIQNHILRQSNKCLKNLPYWPFRHHLPLCTELQPIFSSGTFYLPFNTISDCEYNSIKKDIGKISHNEIIFIPHIRKNDEPSIRRLQALGVSLINVEGESVICYKERSHDTYLSKTIGRKKFRDHSRVLRKSQLYTLKSYRINEVVNDSALYESWSKLFEFHEQKYNNSIFVYGAEFIHELARVTDRNQYEFHFRFKNECVIQVYLTRVINNTLYLIASAINHQMLDKGVNLYTTMMMEAVGMKDRLNLFAVHLGRGGKSEKSNYGANIYIPHVHALYTTNLQASMELQHFELSHTSQ